MTTSVHLPPLLVRSVRLVSAIVIAASVPLFVLTNAVRSVALDDSLYMEEFAKYRVGRVTGLSNSELDRIADRFVDYFQAEPQELRMTVQTVSGTVQLFNEREIHHMVDVQALMRLTFQVRTLALIAFILGTLGVILTGPTAATIPFFKATAIGGASAVLLIGAVSVLAAFDFEQMFLQFHFLSFSNDLWLLDPRRDRLIQLFPQGFFFDLAMRIGFQTVGLGLAIAVASMGVLFTMSGNRQISH